MSSSTRGLALIAVLVLAGCGGESAGDGDGPLTVYVSAPLSGPARADGTDLADGARLALDDAGDEAGGRAVELEVLDGGAEPRGWSPARAAANARTATRDSTAIAYVGDFQSGASRVSLPVTNEAHMLQVSPASGAPDLVAPFPGSNDLPDTQPSGERSFGRVIPSDVAQAAAAAGWGRALGWKRARVVWDRSPFGRTLKRAFTSEAEQLGIVVGAARGARVYIAGGPTSLPSFRPQEVLRVLEGDPDGVIGSDVFLSPYGGAERGLYTSAALAPDQLPPAGRDFAVRFAEETGRSPGRYAAYGYEAVAVVLDSIGRASDPADREAVIDAFFQTTERDSILGSYSIDEVGETTLDRMTGYEANGGKVHPVAELTVP